MTGDFDELSTTSSRQVIEASARMSFSPLPYKQEVAGSIPAPPTSFQRIMLAGWSEAPLFQCLNRQAGSAYSQYSVLSS